ncbi:PAP/OAS1 substrate-binding domain superfamily [Zea mays]|uniref:PAP/OAS1 substrate-binding domain superfamily n=1 Tax=Zea mays TaxID=4577 RepID=A0A1D6QGJ1_MAIZE|nr:PAP/OAS1 substrate-binding domain superfamily [Zea mays]
MVDISECSPVPESVPAHPDPASVSPDAWRRFETAALAVVNKIQPTAASEHLRAAVVDYVQRLFWFQARYQVFVPLASLSVWYCLLFSNICPLLDHFWTKTR